jgi:ribokinase
VRRGASPGHVFSAGTVNADFSLRVNAPLERGASLIASSLLRSSGGRAANVAVMARRLGAAARLFGCVGEDELAEQALAGPRAAGVDVACVRRVPADTGLVTIVVGHDGAKTMIFAPGATEAFSAGDGERIAAQLRESPEHSVLVVDTEVSPGAVLPALEAARERGRVVVVDPTRPQRTTGRLLELADHVCPNADEAEALTGVRVDSPDDARRAAQTLRARGPRYAHVRLRRGGCLTLWSDGEALFRTPEDLEVVDTTGAGDAFAGTLATALVERHTVVDAVRLAVAAAACAVSGFGAQDSYPDRRALVAMARRVRPSVRRAGSAAPATRLVRPR